MLLKRLFKGKKRYNRQNLAKKRKHAVVKP